MLKTLSSERSMTLSQTMCLHWKSITWNCRIMQTQTCIMRLHQVGDIEVLNNIHLLNCILYGKWQYFTEFYLSIGHISIKKSTSYWTGVQQNGLITEFTLALISVSSRFVPFDSLLNSPGYLNWTITSTQGRLVNLRLNYLKLQWIFWQKRRSFS